MIAFESSYRRPKRGFAAMSAQRLSNISSKGGRIAHAKGLAHEFNFEEASKAGKKGGRLVSKNRSHMAKIGQKGGKNSRQNDLTSISEN
jgi:general stress protein YciG